MCDHGYKQLPEQLPVFLREPLGKLETGLLSRLEEIRLGIGRPVLLVLRDGETALDDPEIFSAEMMSRTLLALTGSSLYAMEEEMRQGYLTLPGGHRVGMAGHVVTEAGQVRMLRDIFSLNIRLARSVPGAAASLLPRLLDENRRVRQTLLISPPRGGKTTLLRDLARMLSDGEGCVPHRVGIVDERSEIAGMHHGIPQFDLGIRSDVLDGCPKAEGLMMLLRSMSPEVLLCDEIGRPEDAAALREAANAGVPVIATAHGSCEEDLLERPVMRDLLESRCFCRLVILSRRLGPGTVEKVYAP